MVWFIVLNVLFNDGTLLTEVRVPKSPSYNNEKSCNLIGQLLADEQQAQIKNSGTVFYTCKAMSPSDIEGATGQKQGTDI